jgi:hypothetical protein
MSTNGHGKTKKPIVSPLISGELPMPNLESLRAHWRQTRRRFLAVIRQSLEQRRERLS